ncbi:MAG: type II toxin-antitoxin system prevent-host-death family antitoxin [Firmicutes bacterium]|nr:type II toxin-antitoxin system prevent-host-death family antitoxin [Bacillota bacterium]
MTKFLNLTEARNIFPKVINQVEQGDQVIITRHGKPAAIIIKIDANLLETKAILKSKEMMKKISRAKEDIKAGRLHSYKEAFGEK